MMKMKKNRKPGTLPVLFASCGTILRIPRSDEQWFFPGTLPVLSRRSFSQAKIASPRPTTYPFGSGTTSEKCIGLFVFRPVVLGTPHPPLTRSPRLSKKGSPLGKAIVQTAFRAKPLLRRCRLLLGIREKQTDYEPSPVGEGGPRQRWMRYAKNHRTKKTTNAFSEVVPGPNEGKINNYEEP